MLYKSTYLSFLGIFSLAVMPSIEAHPAFVVAGESIDANEKSVSNGVLAEQAGVKILRRLGAKKSDFSNLYLVNINGSTVTDQDLARYGSVEYVKSGKFAVMELSEKSVENLSGELHHSGMACGAVIALEGTTVKSNRRAPVPVVDVDTSLSQVKAALTQVDAGQIRSTVERLAAIETRHHASPTGQGVADLLVSMYTAHAGARDDVEISTFEHHSISQPSLIVRILGSERPDEIIVLGSHIDSINGNSSTRRAPGADDNASGTATNLEIFRVLMEQNFKPQRTLEIHGYAAEEVGLKGSQEIARQYEDTNKDVVAMVQHDMNLYSATGEDKIWLVSNDTNRQLNGHLISLIENYLDVPHGTRSLWAGTSDHYSWTREGFAASFPFEDPSAFNRSIHTANDTIENAPRFSQAAAFVKLGLAYVHHYGGISSK